MVAIQAYAYGNLGTIPEGVGTKSLIKIILCPREASPFSPKSTSRACKVNPENIKTSNPLMLFIKEK